MVPYLVFGFLFVAGRQVVPVWTRIVLGSSLLIIVIVLVISRKAIFPKNQEVTTQLSRRSGPVRLVFILYAIGIPLTLLAILAQKKWADLPYLIVPVLLALYLREWLSQAAPRQ